MLHFNKTRPSSYWWFKSFIFKYHIRKPLVIIHLDLRDYFLVQIEEVCAIVFLIKSVYYFVENAVKLNTEMLLSISLLPLIESAYWERAA